MQTKPTICSALNRVLRHELTQINQHFLHARMMKNWGYAALNEAFYHQSIRAMKQADAIIERIFFLEGLPNLQDLGKLMIGETPEEALRCDYQTTLLQREAEVKAIAFLETEEDYVSRQLLMEQLKHTESYIDFLEEQLLQLDAMGKENYLQAVAGTQTDN